MNATVEDLRPTIIPKSDQLNAEQLLGGPMTVTVTEVRMGSGEEQPVIVHYEGENGRPFKPCKTMRKVMIHAWGPDGRQWSGRSMTLYNDPSVKFGGEDVGGIRISHMTHIERDIRVSLTSTRGKKARYEIKRVVSRLADHLSAIAHSPTLESLQAEYKAAYKATTEPAWRDQLTSAKDKRKVELQAPASADEKPTARTFSQIAESIKGATSAETAALELDAARSDLPAEQIDELVALYRRTWGEV